MRCAGARLSHPYDMIWLTHMKTTIEISDALLRRAKALAARRNTSLRAVLEAALRDALDHDAPSAKARSVRTHTFGGRGLQPGLSWDDWSTLRDIAYEGRGA